MNRNLLNRESVVCAVILAGFVLLLVSASRPIPLSAFSSHIRKNTSAAKDDRGARQAELKLRLHSTNSNEFRDALASLSRLDEPGALEVWSVALSNGDPRLKREAWS